MKRIFHPWSSWENYHAGFYAIGKLSDERIREDYANFLRDIPRFSAALERVLREWPKSCEQFLSNEHLNRIAWLGQAAMCIDTGIPACFRGGFRLLTDAEQAEANAVALACLNRWLEARGEAIVDSY